MNAGSAHSLSRKEAGKELVIVENTLHEMLGVVFRRSESYAKDGERQY